MYQHPLAWVYVHGTMHHLVSRDVIQDETDSLGRIQSRWHRHQLAFRQTDDLCICTVDRQPGDNLPWLDFRDGRPEAVHLTNKVPPGREWHRRRFGMNASRAITSGRETPAANTLTRTSPDLGSGILPESPEVHR